MFTITLIISILCCFSLSEARELDHRVLESSLNYEYLRVMIVCGMHARESYTTKICSGMKKNENMKMLIIDVANPEGIELARIKDECWRGNANGVDLNRNWPHTNSILWKKTHAKGDEEYPGEFPFSEWETLSLNKLTIEFMPTVLLVIHSGELAVMLPRDGSYIRPPDYTSIMNTTKRAVTPHCKRCKIGSSIDIIGYKAMGTFADYAYDELKIPYVYTLETYYNNTNNVGCFDMFNPLDDGHSQEYVAAQWHSKIIPSLLEEIYKERFVTRRLLTMKKILNK